MSAIIQINGREAVPVRAIPFLTNWGTMSPDAVAQALAWNEHFYKFHGLSAYRIESTGIKEIPPTWWENFACVDLAALDAELKREEDAGIITSEKGLQQWRRSALQILPSGVFVWKDEFEPLHVAKYGVDGTTYLSDKTKSGEMPKEEHARRVTLDYSPFIADSETRQLVMEGFIKESERVRAENRATQAHWAGIKDDLKERRGQSTKSLLDDWQEKLAPAPPPRVESLTAPATTDEKALMRAAARFVNPTLGDANRSLEELAHFEQARIEGERAKAKARAEGLAAGMAKEAARPETDKPEPAPVVSTSDNHLKSAAPVDRGWVMKRAALIKEHATQWPTANRDFRDASENGLSKAAKAPGHGEWFEADALKWAEKKGKLTKEKQQSPTNSIFSLKGTKHTIEG